MLAESARPDGAPRLDATADVIGALDSLEAAEDVVLRLALLTPVDTWLFLRESDGEWVVLAAADPNYGFLPGDAFDDEHPVVRLSGATGPPSGDVVIDLSGVESRIDVELPDSVVSIGSIVRVGLRTADGSVLGMLVGLQPAAITDAAELRRARPVLELVGRLLVTVFDLDIGRGRLQRRLEAAENAALSDELTGLGNRRAFERAVEREEARCRRFGHRAGVLVIDLDGLKQVNDTDGHAAGDELIRCAAQALRRSIRSADLAFRTGGDEFAVLLPEITVARAGQIVERIREAFLRAGVEASIGSAIRSRSDDLRDATERADARMYVEKRDR